MKPRALILHATGTNRDLDAAAALELAGANPEIVHINLLRQGERRFHSYQMLVVPGGFSYADALGAGRLFALDLKTYFAAEVREFVAAGKPVIGICNGFQALVKSGILPGRQEVQATLTFNAAGHFECRWVTLLPTSERCLWTRGLEEPVRCPVAHGEGNFTLASRNQLDALHQGDQVALIYASNARIPAGEHYPDNPNGSTGDIAGVCNPDGNVLGLMPHPENHIFSYQRLGRTTGEPDSGSGLRLFQNGVRHASQM